MKYKDENGNWIPIVLPSLDSNKVGTILPYAGSTAPDNYMICDGSAISRTTYNELFATIGTTFGAGNGSTTFNIPNLKGRVPVGLDSSQTEFDTLGETGGSKYLQQHNHAYDIKINSGSGDVGQYLIVANNTGTPYAGATGAISNTGTGDSGNLQPYQVVNYIIKVSMTIPTSAQIVDGFSESSTDGYSCAYVNDKIVNVGTEVDSSFKVNFINSKNLFNGNSTLGYVEYNGTIIANSGWTSSQSYVPVKPNTTYIIYGINMGARLLYCEYDDNQTMTGSRTETTPNTPITTGNDTYYIRFSTNTGTATNMVVQEGSSISTPSIYVDGEKIYNKGTILYQNNSGATGNLTLNDDISN